MIESLAGIRAAFEIYKKFIYNNENKKACHGMHTGRNCILDTSIKYNC